MSDIAKILLTLAVASAGGFLFIKLKVPSGAMIGAMVLTIVLTLVTGLAFIPRNLRIVIQILAGIRVGSNITKKDVLELRRLFVPAIILVVSMVILNLLFGSAMLTVGGLDPATALFSCAPGGMADMALIADDLGANPVYVVVLQLSRILFIYIFLPPIFRSRMKKEEARRLTEALTGEAAEEAKPEKRVKPNYTTKEKTLRFLCTAAAGACAGLICWRLGVKAGALLGAMAGVAILNISTGYVYFPKKLNVPIRVVSGGYIGQQMNLASLMLMTTLGVPVLIMWAGVLAFTFVVPMVIAHFSKLDFATAMIASTPGGMQEMSLLAEDMGADVPKVTLLQTARQVSVIMIFPTMLSAISVLLS